MKIRDRFLYFTFNGRHSSEFDLFYVNSGEDLSLPFTPSVKRNTVSPLYQNRTYIVGSSKGPQQLKLKVAADRKELNEIGDILEWLNPGTIGQLSFDHRPDYVYNVHISSVTDPTVVPWETVNNRIKNVVYFDITFETYDSHSAETRESYILPDLINNDTKYFFEPDRLLPIYSRTSETEHKFINWSNVPQNFNLISSGTGLTVKRKQSGKENIIYRYSGVPVGTIVQLDTEIGAMRYMDSILEQHFKDNKIVNEGPLEIEPGTVFSGQTKLSVEGNIVKINIDSRFQNLGNAHEVYIQIDEEDKDSLLKPNSDKDYWFKGYYEHDSENKIIIPKFELGVVSYEGGQSVLKFPNENLNVTDGVYNIRVAKASSIIIEPIGGKVNLDFKYKKER